MRIRIIETPHEEKWAAPEEIRRCWVGIELEAIEKVVKSDLCVLTGRKTVNGYRVDAATAFEALKAHNEAAWDWWTKKYPDITSTPLGFCAKVCKEIP